MNAVQKKFRGGWRRSAVLLVIVGGILAVGVSGLFAEGPDSTKSGLREGQFVAWDTVKHPQSQVSLEALRRLNKNSTRRWTVEWEESSGLPSLGGGNFGSPFSGDAAGVAKSFVEEHKDLLLGISDTSNLDVYSFQQRVLLQDKQLTSVIFDELYRGVKVYNAGVAVWLTEESGIISVHNSLRPVNLENVTPTLSKADAESIIRRLAAPDSVVADTYKCELCIYPSTPPRLVYHTYRYTHGWWWTLIVDAQSGEMIDSRKLGCSQETRRLEDAKAKPRKSKSEKDNQLPPPPFVPSPGQMFPLPDQDSVHHDSVKVGQLPQRSSLSAGLPHRNRTGGLKQFSTASPLLPCRPNPTGCCYFYDVEFDPGEGESDGDGYVTTSWIGWDADTKQDSSMVQVFILGRTAVSEEYLLAEFQLNPYYIKDADIDWVGQNFSVPFKEDWSFRLLLTDRWEDSLDGFPYGCDPTMVDVPMESEYEDLAHTIENATVHYLPRFDVDHDGYSVLDSLTVLVYISPYDTTAPANFRLRVYARDTLGAEHLIFQTPWASQPRGVEQWWWMYLWAGHEGLWDFQVQLVNSFGEVAFILNYGMDAELMNVPMELWIEDPRRTYVFNPNPVVALFDNPSIDVDTLRDDDNANTPALMMALTPVNLQDVWLMPGVGYWLKGPYVGVADWAPFSTDSAVSYDTKFPYFRSEDQFEEVMCYYHIDHNQRYLQSLGVTQACNWQIPVDAHGMADTANAEYRGVPDGTGKLVFGDGGVDWAEDADFILHEYAHAIQNSQAPNIYLSGNGDRGWGNETYYMEEGFGFYWAASYTDSASQAHGYPSGWIGEWVVKGEVPSGTHYYNIDNGKTYPDSFVYWPSWNWEHRNGEVWGAALWDIFQQYGRRIADSLVLRSHELMRISGKTDPLLEDGARKILAADSAGYSGAHAVGIRTIFVDRGILEYCNCGATTTLKLWADCNCDGAINAVDVVRMVNYVFKSQLGQLVNCPGVIYPNIPPPGPNPNPTCPRKLGDANWDGFVNPVDVVRYTNFVYKSQLAQICNNPCLSPDCL